ncbi:hypothetical protein GCM10027276_09310 [Comamonas piscis]
MQIKFAHLRERAVNGGSVNFVVFEANSTSNSDSARASVLAKLTARARASGLRVDQSALAFSENGRIRFYGTRTLVDYLARSWSPRWTHTLTV